MKKTTWAWLAWVFLAAGAQAQSDVLIEVNTGRTEGLFSRSPSFMRAILARPEQPGDTALLWFRGSPGYARLQGTGDKMRHAGSFLRQNLRLLSREGVALVIMDCPSDQWGSAADTYPLSCLDDYRSSRAHADDVRLIMAKLRTEHGLSRFFVMGHSVGSVSAHWLALHLGREIEGSITSATLTVPNRPGFARSLSGFRYTELQTPLLFLHHEADACRFSPYAGVKDISGVKLITVRGGSAEGDPCGGGHLHSYQGRETAVVRAIIGWMKTGQHQVTVGE